MKWNKIITLIIILTAFTYLMEAEQQIFTKIRSISLVQHGIDTISQNAEDLKSTMENFPFDSLSIKKNQDSL